MGYKNRTQLRRTAAPSKMYYKASREEMLHPATLNSNVDPTQILGWFDILQAFKENDQDGKRIQEDVLFFPYKKSPFTTCIYIGVRSEARNGHILFL